MSSDDATASIVTQMVMTAVLITFAVQAPGIDLNNLKVGDVFVVPLRPLLGETFTKVAWNLTECFRGANVPGRATRTPLFRLFFIGTVVFSAIVVGSERIGIMRLDILVQLLNGVLMPLVVGCVIYLAIGIALLSITDRRDAQVVEIIEMKALIAKQQSQIDTLQETVSSLGIKKGHMAMESVVATRSLDWSARQRDVVALAKVNKKGDASAIAQVMAVLEKAPKNGDASVRAKAVTALAELAEKGDASAIAVVTARLRDRREAICTQEAAANALAAIAEKGDASAIALLTACLEGEVAVVRRAAVTAMATIAEKGDATAIASVTARTKDERSSVRIAAEVALVEMTGEGKANAIAVVAASLKDEFWSVRRDAAEALAAIAENGDANAIAAVTPLLEDKDDDVRKAARKTLNVLQGN